MAEITNKEMKTLQNKFKNGFKGFYINDLVKAMNTRKSDLSYEKEFNENAIYNIFNGIIKNQIIRAILLEEGNKLLKKYQGDITEVKTTANTELQPQNATT